MSELTIFTAPRHPFALLQLSAEQRCKLFDELCLHPEKRRLKPGKTAFKRLEADQQVGFLLEHLINLDRDTAGYTVTPVTLPVLSKSQRANERKMSAFAAKLETVLNEMNKRGFTTLQMLNYNSHGTLVVGFKPAPAQIFGVGALPPMMPFAMPDTNDPAESAAFDESKLDAGTKAALPRMLNKLEGRKAMRGKLAPKDFEEVVHEEQASGLSHEQFKCLVTVLSKAIDLHDKSTPEPEHTCHVSEVFKPLRDELDKQGRLQLS